MSDDPDRIVATLFRSPRARREREAGNKRALQDLAFALLGSSYARKLFDTGNKDLLLLVILLCARHKRKIPQWASDAFTEICTRAWSGEVESWDNVFGRPWGDDKKQQRRIRTELRAGEVWKRVWKLHRAEGAPRTNPLFERVGKELGMSRTTISRLYYMVEKRLEGRSPEEKDTALPRPEDNED